MASKQQWFILIALLVTGSLVYFLSPVLMPFVVGVFIAYFLDPVVELMAKWRVPRTFAVVMVFVISVLILLLLLAFIVPLLEKQILLFFNTLPKTFNWLQQVALPWINQKFGFDYHINLQEVRSQLSGHWQQAGNIAVELWRTVSQSTLMLVGFFANVVLIPVVAFYLLRDWQKLGINVKALLPRTVEATVVDFCRRCDEVVAAFFRGQLLVMLALGILYSLGLTLIGLNFGLLIGNIAGLVSIVPYLGFIVGFAAAIIAALVQFHDVTHLVYVAIVFIIGQLAEGCVLTPLLVGDRIGLHPVAVIFAILVGGQLFGFVGVLLALPFAAILMVLLRDLYIRYQNSELYQ